MTYLQKRPASVNTTNAGDREREFYTRGLNTSIARARLTLNTLETIACALRHKQSSLEEVKAWIKDEGLETLVTRRMPGGAS